MIFCHNCQANRQQNHENLACAVCGCEAVEIIEETQPVINTRLIMSNPLDFFMGFRSGSDGFQGFSRTNGTFGGPMMFQQFLQPFSTMMESGPGYTVIILNGQPMPDQKVDESVPKQVIQKLPTIDQLQEQCSICQQKSGKGVKLPCSHEFHQDCIEPWFANKNSCPCCRQKL